MCKLIRKSFAIMAGASLLALPSALAQNNEDEWYDPTDWFDGNNYEYDDSIGLDYSYYDDEIGTDTWGYNDYDYGWNDGYDYGDNDYDWGLNDNGDYDNEWGFDNDFSEWDEGVGSSGVYDEGSGFDDDWGYNRGYGTEQSWESDRRSSQSRQGQSNMRQSSSNQRNQSQARQTRVSGTLERSRQLTVKDNQQRDTQFTVAQVEQQNGRDVLVAFKGRDHQNRLNLQNGNQLSAQGKVIRINGRRVLLADQIRTNGRSFDVRQVSAQEMRQSHSQTPERGRVQQTRRYRNDQGHEHTIMLIQFENGRTALVDLGPTQTTF